MPLWDRNSAQLTGDSVDEMLAWMGRTQLPVQSSFLDGTDSSAGGSGGPILLVTLMLLGFPRSRKALAHLRKTGNSHQLIHIKKLAPI